METYQAITSWALFLGLGVFCILYYWPDNRQQHQQSGTANERRRSYAEAVKSHDAKPKHQSEAAARRKNAENRKPQAKAPAPSSTTTTTPVIPPRAREQEEEPEVDSSTKHFAEQMLKARKGEVISGNRSQESRIRTVKQSSAANTPQLASDEATFPSGAPPPPPSPGETFQSGDVSDMLEPSAPGPGVLRVTPSTKPIKERTPRPAAKEEVAESKKQRQNRKKVEAGRLQREADEEERRVMMEKQRRGAREARGEPARNGVPAQFVSTKTPTTKNVWAEGASAPVNEAPAAGAGAVNGLSSGNQQQQQPLLDTFDAETAGAGVSNGVNGGGALGISSSAPKSSSYSTNNNNAQWDRHAFASEEDQIAQAMKESGDDSGWTTVAVPSKKQQQQQQQQQQQSKKTTSSAVSGEEAATKVGKTAAVNGNGNGKAKGGFQALEVQYDVAAGADPDDPDNWEA